MNYGITTDYGNKLRYYGVGRRRRRGDCGGPSTPEPYTKIDNLLLDLQPRLPLGSSLVRWVNAVFEQEFSPPNPTALDNIFSVFAISNEWFGRHLGLNSRKNTSHVVTQLVGIGDGRLGYTCAKMSNLKECHGVEMRAKVEYFDMKSFELSTWKLGFGQFRTMGLEKYFGRCLRICGVNGKCKMSKGF
ncbi:hypothetical protein K438DRAFT_1762836 [Mycena galopus ATCC 62051]|nr:hypothetical protein K438DRAFT_1762836 [Mycena galopus ATCC 62051]